MCLRPRRFTSQSATIRLSMLKLLNRYILRQIVMAMFAMTAVALLALLLDRLLRLLDRVVDSQGSMGIVVRMLINLVPHYLGIAIPAAFFFAVLLIFNKLHRDSEMAVINAAGVGLHRLLVPVMGLALVLTMIAAIIFSYMQPYSRYAYRALVNAVVHASLSAAVEAGTFVRVEDMTFMAEQASADGHRLGRIFVHEKRPNGRSVTTTASEGLLQEAEDGSGSVLVLRDGSRNVIEADGRGGGVIGFEEYRWPIKRDPDWAFRPRGGDEEELTLPELWGALDAPPAGTTSAQIAAEFHSRIVQALSIVVLPLLAVPLALGGGRRGQTYGIVVGLIVLIVYEKLLDVGHAMSAVGEISPWLSLWLPLAAMAIGSSILFIRASFRVSDDPLGQLPTLLEALRHRIGRMLRPAHGPA